MRLRGLGDVWVLLHTLHEEDAWFNICRKGERKPEIWFEGWELEAWKLEGSSISKLLDSPWISDGFPSSQPQNVEVHQSWIIKGKGVLYE